MGAIFAGTNIRLVSVFVRHRALWGSQADEYGSRSRDPGNSNRSARQIGRLTDTNQFASYRGVSCRVVPMSRLLRPLGRPPPLGLQREGATDFSRLAEFWRYQDERRSARRREMLESSVPSHLWEYEEPAAPREKKKRGRKRQAWQYMDGDGGERELTYEGTTWYFLYVGSPPR